jgi:F-type H+-transporting ATPase subunit b
MHTPFLLASGGGIVSDLSDTARETALTFGLNWPHFLSQVISFCIVAFLLYRWAYQPILKLLEQRRQQIAEGLENAEKIKNELQATAAARQEILNKTSAEAARLIDEARAVADKLREQESQKAIASAEQIIAKAREAAEQDHSRMLAELKKEIGRLVVQTTVTVTGKVLTPEDQKRLAEETTRQISA